MRRQHQIHLTTEKFDYTDVELSFAGLTGALIVQKVIEIDQVEEPVKQFLEALDTDPDGSNIEMNDRRIYLLVRPANGEPHSDEPWTDEKNCRRAALVDKQIKGALTPAETVELANLQEQLFRYRDRVAPLPIEYARRLHQQLLEDFRAESNRK